MEKGDRQESLYGTHVPRVFELVVPALGVHQAYVAGFHRRFEELHPEDSSIPEYPGSKLPAL